jgi:hypothetical protein
MAVADMRRAAPNAGAALACSGRPYLAGVTVVVAVTDSVVVTGAVRVVVVVDVAARLGAAAGRGADELLRVVRWPAAERSVVMVVWTWAGALVAASRAALASARARAASAAETAADC